MVEEPPQQAMPDVTPCPYPDLHDGKNSNWAGVSISEERLRALALGVVQSFTWGGYEDVLTLSKPDRDRKDDAIEGLHGWWGVNGPEDLLDSVRSAQRGMHAPLYSVVHPLVVEALDSGGAHNAPDTLPSRHRDFLRACARYRGEPDDTYSRYYDLWLQAHRLELTSHVPKPLANNIVGWDICRAAWLVRAGHTAGYLAEEPAWALLLNGLKIAQQTFGNWRQVADSYLSGHAFWSALDLSDFEEQTKTRRRWVLGHLDRPGSPWRKVSLHQGDSVY